MSECRFCHKDAGLFKHEHEECRRKYEEAKVSVSKIIDQCFVSKTDFYTKSNEINSALSSGMIAGEDRDKR